MIVVSYRSLSKYTKLLKNHQILSKNLSEISKSLNVETFKLQINSTSSSNNKIVTLDGFLSPIKWYSCGPTVYDVAHLGHARSYVCNDIIRRIMTNFFGFEVNYALGMTDIDDKIINRANESTELESIERKCLNVARKYEKEFLDDMDALNVLRPNTILRVSEHINDIIEYLKGIESQGYTYQTEDGLYFDLQNFMKTKTYGKLGSIPPIDANDDNEHNGSIIGKENKRHSRDFVLWKSNKKTNELSFESPWGLGRPGWHIECSAMTYSYFGNKLDIHSGGIDLLFPHHTNEIAQW